MKFSAELKQHILTQYTAHSIDNSYRALSRRYGLASDGRTIKRWMKQWDGTAASLNDGHRSGRPRLLTDIEVHNNIHQPVVAANRRHECIDYSSLHRRLTHTIHKRVSLRTVQRYGRQRSGVRGKRARRLSSHERTHTHTHTHTHQLILTHAAQVCYTVCVNA